MEVFDSPKSNALSALVRVLAGIVNEDVFRRVAARFVVTRYITTISSVPQSRRAEEKRSSYQITDCH